MPHLVRPLSLLLATGLFLAGTGPLCAQRQNNFKQLNSQFTTQNATGVFLEPDQVMGTSLTGPNGAGSSFVGRLPSSLTQQLSTGFSSSLPSINQGLTGSHSNLSSRNFSTSLSSLNGDMDGSPMWRGNFPIGRNFPLTMAPAPNLRQPQMATSLQRNSSLNDYSAYNRWKSPTLAPGKFTDAFVFHTVDNSKQLEQVGRELSLQDINRYQFQGEFSSQPGLPVTHAGGDVDQVAASNGQILHSPKLFDFNPSQGNNVPSGGAVAPRMITSEGSQPYVPHNPSFPGANTANPLFQNNAVPSATPPTGTPAPAARSNPAPSTGGTAPRALPKNEALLPAGQYQYTTPDGHQLPVELGAPEVTIQTDN